MTACSEWSGARGSSRRAFGSEMEQVDYKFSWKQVVGHIECFCELAAWPGEASMILQDCNLMFCLSLSNASQIKEPCAD